MKNKKVLVRFLKDCYRKKGQEEYVSIRQAESWAFMGLCEIIDKDVEVKKSKMCVEVLIL